MASLRKRLIATAALSMSVALGGCMGDYGYGGVGYASDYYDGYGPGYAYNSYGGYGGGWYNDFYYPGSGIYVFDRGGHRSRWNDTQRRYWQSRGHYGQNQQRQGRPNGWQGRRDGWRGQGPSWRNDRRGTENRGADPRPAGVANGQWRGRTPGTGPVGQAPQGAGRSWGNRTEGARTWGNGHGGGRSRGGNRGGGGHRPH